MDEQKKEKEKRKFFKKWKVKDNSKGDSINKKNYTTLQNMMYVMKGTFKWQKILIPLLCINAIAEASLPFIWVIIPKYIYEVVEKNKGMNALIKVIIISAIVQITLLAIYTFINHEVWWRFISARMKFINLKLRKSLTMSYENLENPEMLDWLQKAGDATGGNTNGLEGIMHSFRTGLVNIIKIIASSAIMFTLNPLIILVMFFLAFLHFLLIDYTKRIDKLKTWDPLAKQWRKLNYMDNVTTNFDYGKDIRLFHMKVWLHEKQKALHNEIHKKFVEHKNRWLKCGILNQFIGLLQEGILYVWLIYSVIYKDLSIANCLMYFGTIRTFIGTISYTLDNLAEIRRQSLQINDFRTFVEYPDNYSNIEASKVIPIPKDDNYEFTFDHVSFRYRGSEQYALNDLSLTLYARKRLAVVGLNGAGKTTFIKLLCRLYEPTKGRILLNGIDIREFDLVEYHKLIAPVFQTVECFAFPICENVSMKPPGDTDVELALSCLNMAGLEEKISSLPKGVHTEMLKVLHDDGIDLSGGEKQKLALARALYKDAPIVVLDEPTSALDAIAEYNLYMDFDKMIGDKTAIYISHRLSSTKFCHSIAMFHNGSVIEYGTHEELLLKGGEYANMFLVQAQYYKEVDEEVACCE